MKHFYIISGGSIEDEFAVQYIRWDDDYHLIAADSGMEFLYRNHIVPEVIIGDFDSVSAETLEYFRSHQGIDWHKLNPKKDDTDTEFAIRLAIEMGAEKITILGGTGSRMDHVLGNIELLGIGMRQNIPVELVDANNRIRMISDGIILLKGEQFGDYVSLVPYTEEVKHVTLRGFKYPLKDYCLKGFCSIGISNEIIQEEAQISFAGGILLVIESRD